MDKILIAYTTNSGTTTEVAKAIGEELAKGPAQVEILRIEEVSTLEPYTAVVIGAPMMMGWHRAAVEFMKALQEAQSHVPVAYFFTAMRLTQTPDKQVSSVPVYVDANLAKPPKKAGHLSFKERFATPSNYLKAPLKAAPQVKPVSAAFFGGRLDLFRLKWWQMAFVMVVVQASPGEFRNWPAIRDWPPACRRSRIFSVSRLRRACSICNLHRAELSTPLTCKWQRLQWLWSVWNSTHWHRVKAGAP